MMDRPSSTDAKIVRSFFALSLPSTISSCGSAVNVRVAWITKAVRKEHAVPHSIVNGTAIRTEGPKKRRDDPGRQVDGLYPPNPFVVCKLPAVEERKSYLLITLSWNKSDSFIFLGLIKYTIVIDILINICSEWVSGNHFYANKMSWITLFKAFFFFFWKTKASLGILHECTE